MYNENYFPITRKKKYATREMHNTRLYCPWNTNPFIFTMGGRIMRDLFQYHNISEHAYKHLYPTEEYLREGVADEDYSYWKKPKKKKLALYLDRIFKKCYYEISNFVSNIHSNSLILKMKTKKCTGYLRKRGETEFKEVHCYCVIIDKHPEGLVVKTAYPCEDCTV